MQITCKLCEKPFDETEHAYLVAHDLAYPGDVCQDCHIRGTPKPHTYCPLSGRLCSADCGWFCKNTQISGPYHGYCVLHKLGGN